MKTTELPQGVEVCICTHNRKDYLQQCLEALIPQLVQGKSMLAVVDNHSSDGTKEYVQSLARDNHLIRYHYEPQQGLSHARNTAWKEATFEWIFYLDDDCLPPAGIIDAALQLIDEFKSLDAIGGPITPLFTDKVPDWLPSGFGHFSMPYHDVTPIDKGFIRGGCFMIKKAVLESLDGFNPELGVRGKELQYGEEIELQERMRKVGFSIGYSPSLRTDHFVRTDKLTIRWVLRSEYARRRDKMSFDPVPLPVASMHLLRTMAGRMIWTPIHLLSSMFNKSYPFKKAVYEISQPLAYSTGEWIGSLRSSMRKR
jgi:GT2 family glycosyltransferase